LVAVRVTVAASAAVDGVGVVQGHEDGSLWGDHVGLGGNGGISCRRAGGGCDDGNAASLDGASRVGRVAERDATLEVDEFLGAEDVGPLGCAESGGEVGQLVREGGAFDQGDAVAEGLVLGAGAQEAGVAVVGRAGKEDVLAVYVGEVQTEGRFSGVSA